jgi:hypothetical protein
MSLSCRSPRARRFRGADFSVLAVEVTEKINHYVMAVTLPERVACDDPSVLTLALGWRCAMRLIPTMAVLALSSMWSGSVEAGPTYAPAEVAYVSEVSGRVVAFGQGRPMLLDVLDVVADQTRLDLLANSELQICHSRMRQVFVLRGPLKAMISQDGVTIDNGNG